MSNDKKTKKDYVSVEMKVSLGAKEQDWRINYFEHKSNFFYGYVSVEIHQDGKCISFYNGLKLLLGKDDKFYLSEPLNVMLDKEGKPNYGDSNKYYLLPMSTKEAILNALKDDLPSKITENKKVDSTKL